MRRYAFIVACVLLAASLPAFATIFGSVRGVVHDPQHRPIRGARVTLKAKDSSFTQSQDSNSNGEFLFTSVPIGDYTVTASYKGFQETSEDVIVESDTRPVLHLQLAIEGAKELVTVYETPGQVTTDSATPTTLLSRRTIQQTP
ncbi:MAG: carboxypeptidase-like regulatory domain-containing protein, partial [Acidobacteriota bacterium]